MDMTNSSAPRPVSAPEQQWGAPAAAWGVPPVPERIPPLEPAPDTPYQHLFREPGRRWWRPVVSLLVLAIVGAIVMVGVRSVDQRLLEDPKLVLEDASGWSVVVLTLVMNLSLAALIPAVLLANRVAHRLPVGYTHSVVGRFRFGWAAKVTLALLPVWLGYVVVSFLAEPFPLFTHVETPAVTAALVAVVLLTTPFQAAGEEYAFRGWLLQNVGLLIPRPLIAAVVPTLMSAALFALAHGSLDPWMLMTLAIMALTAVHLTIRTGGLEAAVAFHSLNNVLIFVFQAAFGVPAMTGIVTADSAGTGVGALVLAVFSGLVVLAVEWLARREGIRPTR